MLVVSTLDLNEKKIKTLINSDHNNNIVSSSIVNLRNDGHLDTLLFF